MVEPLDEGTDLVRAWLEDRLGPVTMIRRQPRWRPVWFADVDRGAEVLELCVRGDRTDMPLIFPLDHEMRFQSVLHDNGIPTARVYGWIDRPKAYVMDRVPGRNDFSGVSNAERDAVVDDYLQVLARLHALQVEEIEAAGIASSAPSESGLVGLRAYERVYRSTKRRPDPFMEFCLGWLQRNPARSHSRQAPVVWDSGQFHHRDGKVVAVLDLEIGHIGDPMMDLAGWRMRDTIVGFGEFGKLYDRYAELTGQPVDIDAIQIYHFAFTLTNQLALGAAAKDPTPESDMMTNLQWCCETNLFATEALADMLGIEAPTVDMPEPTTTRAATGHAHLVRRLRTLQADDEYVRYQLRAAFRLARHLERAQEIGSALDEADLDDLHRLLGRRPETWQEGDAELERFVLSDAGAGRHDEDLVQLFHRRNLRAQMLLGPAGSAMARHLPIQRFHPAATSP
jgi:aminoglycoside phosphotransferase (APT) family kinase protein